MDQFVYRGKVRILAYIDIGLSGLTLALGVIFMMYAFFVSSAVQTVAAESEDTEVIVGTSAVLTVLWIVLICMMISDVIKILAALRLLKACNVDSDPKVSYELCKFWRNVNIGYIAFMVLAALGESQFRFGYLFHSVLYCLAILLVQQYMQELQTLEFIPNSDPIMMNENSGQMQATTGNYDEEHAFGSMPPPQYSATKGQEQW